MEAPFLETYAIDERICVLAVFPRLAQLLRSFCHTTTTTGKVWYHRLSFVTCLLVVQTTMPRATNTWLLWRLSVSLVACVWMGVSLAKDEDVHAAERLLQEMEEAMDAFDRVDALVQQAIQSVDETLQRMEDIETHRANVEMHQINIQDTWTEWNHGQYQQLQQQMKDVVRAEIERREHAQEQVEEYVRQKEYYLKASMDEKEAASSSSTESKVQDLLTQEEMEDMLSLEEFLQQRDTKIGHWVANEVFPEIIQKRPLPKYEWADRAKAILTPTASHSEEEGCWTLLDATEYIQQVLTNYSHGDGLGVIDHAQGGWISHQGTTPTYHAPLSGETWGTSPWRDYLIPEEVEEHILSHFEGWKDWPVWPVKYLPRSLVTTLFGSSTLTTAPPETILQPATFPGACWPMQGSSGQVTIVLPYAIHPTAISIDHVSRLLTPEDEGREAAPKTMRVSAYGSCGDNNCHGREYDETAIYELFGGQTITYELAGSSVQTFWIPTLAADESSMASCTAPEDHEMEENVIPSCSAGAPSVLSKDTLVRAIKLEVIDNWGHGEYTCLYRARVHGDPFR